MGPLIASILPSGVASTEAFDDPPDATLFPEEEALLARAVDKRRREFTTTRLCARRALASLGVAPVPILPGPRGAPQWPPAIVGSMTHCANYRAAAVAPASQVATIGIDAEPHAPLPDTVLDAVALPHEAARMHELLDARPEVRWDRLLFCIKETVYKAWFPLTHRWLGFEGADVTVDPDNRSFVAHLTVAGPQVAGRELTTFAGRWTAEADLLLTAIVVPTDGEEITNVSDVARK